MTKNLLLASAFLWVLSSQASAYVVEIEDLPGFNGQEIDDLDPSFGSNGPVSIDWDPFNDANRELLLWNDGYSGRDAAWCRNGSFNSCELHINVAAGYEVSLESFFLGGWPNTDRTIAWSVIDLATNLVVAFGNPAVSGVTGLVETIGLSSTVGFSILFGPDGFNGGINDITYEYRDIDPSTVPLPGGLLLLGTALGGLAAVRSRRRKAA